MMLTFRADDDVVVLESRAAPMSAHNVALFAGVGDRLMNNKKSSGAEGGAEGGAAAVTFVGCTPSVCAAVVDGRPLLLVVRRFVNYRITDAGEYVAPRERAHVTRNVLALIDASQPQQWRLVSEAEVAYDASVDGGWCVGVEDVRAFPRGGKVLYTGSRGMKDGSVQVEFGELDVAAGACVAARRLRYAKRTRTEKNWALFPGPDAGGGGAVKCVYRWFPLTIGDIRGDEFVETHVLDDVPPFFQQLRGSTCGAIVGDELWFIVHRTTERGQRRFYHHAMVALDRTTFAPRRHTPLFTFCGASIEFTLGFTYDAVADQLLIGYSAMDRETRCLAVARSVFVDMFNSYLLLMQQQPPQLLGWDSVPLLVINLDRRPDRRAAVTAELARLGRTWNDARVPTLRASAVDHPADGALGCSLSHLQCLERAIAERWPAVAVLEDDFACTQPAAFRRAVDAFLETAQQSSQSPRWDVLLLGANVRKSTPSLAFGGGDGSVHRVQGAWSAAAYLVNGPYLPTFRDNIRASAQLLAGRPQLRHQYALDVYWQRLQARDAWFVSLPLTVTQAPGFSDIERVDVDYTAVMLRPVGGDGGACK